MPETSIDEDGHPGSFEYEVRRSGQPHVQSVAEATCPQGTPKEELGFGTGCPNTCHQARTLLGGHHVHERLPRRGTILVAMAEDGGRHMQRRFGPGYQQADTVPHA